MLTFLVNYWPIITFYVILILILIWRRKHWDLESKILILYRTKWGLKLIEKIAQRYREWVKLLGYIGIGAGYVGLIGISYILIKNLIDLLVKPQAVSGMSLVLPGINVPGMGVLPFWYWIIAIFIIAIVHEFAHGIVARAHNIEVKNTGLVFLGPILGAFVEPDEKKLQKEKDITQYSVLAAGSFSNLLLAVVALLLLNLAFTPLQDTMVTPAGFSFASYVDETLPAALVGIPTNTVITAIDDTPVSNFQEFSEELASREPGDTIIIETAAEEYALTLAANPDDPQKSFLGISDIKNEFTVKEKYEAGVWSIVYYSVNWVSGLLRWLFLLSLGIGLFNLLPLPIVDGGRMAQTFLRPFRGPGNGEKRYRQLSLLFLLILLLNLFFPLLVKLF